MPYSDISRISINFGHRPMNDGAKSIAAAHAKEAARREISHRIRTGSFTYTDEASYRKEYESIYYQEYYKCYAHILQQSKVVYVEKPGASKYLLKHTVANFSKSNYFVQVHKGCITVGRFEYPLDDDLSPETKEAFLSAWPGPLDKLADNLKFQVTNYIDTLWQHDSQRRIRYCNSTNDDQRKTILKLLTELLHRNGSIDAPGITKLLLKPEQTEIQKDESSKNPLETLQKYLLLGKRNEAVKFAKTKRLWDHAQCLAFLEKYQPGLNLNHYKRDNYKLKDDSIIQLNHEYISSLNNGILTTVYRSLLNRILQSDPESASVIKNHNVGSNIYEFALLSANDCDIEFDQTNETFKLIMATKQSKTNPRLANSHLISLGHSSVDNYDPSDDLSYRSHLSFHQGDTYASRTLTISNIDLLILNEIWEYCLNLDKGSSQGDSAQYNFIANLIPYKLVFASKLLDFGLFSMFSKYLESLEMALFKASKPEVYHELDSFYDWNTISMSVKHLRSLWNDIFCNDPEMLVYRPSGPGYVAQLENFEPVSKVRSIYDQIETTSSYAVTNTDYQPDYVDSPYNNYNLNTNLHENPYPSLQLYPQQEHISQPQQDQYPIAEEMADLDLGGEPLSPPIEDRNFDEPKMTSSSPVDKRRESTQSNHIMGESFTNAFSPINRYDDLPRPTEPEQPQVLPPPPPLLPPQPISSQPRANTVTSPQSSGNSSSPINNNSEHTDKNAESKTQPSGDQQAGFLSNLVGTAKSLLPKSNSKPMILPRDDEKKIVYDNNLGTWVDKSQPEGTSNHVVEAPPIMNISKQQQTNYSFPAKSTKSRYPRA